MPTLAELLSGIHIPGPSSTPIPAQTVPYVPIPAINYSQPLPTSEEEAEQIANQLLWQRILASEITNADVNNLRPQFQVDDAIAAMAGGPGGQMLQPPPQGAISAPAQDETWLHRQGSQGKPALPQLGPYEREALAKGLPPPQVPQQWDGPPPARGLPITVEGGQSPQLESQTMKSWFDVVAPQQGGTATMQSGFDVVPAARPPATPEEATQRASKWQGILQKLQDPDTLGALQTFFATLSAPMAPWETGWSRLGRASQMYNLHRSMLEENRKNLPREEEMKQIELEKARAGRDKEVAGATVEKETVKAKIEKARQEVAKLKSEGRWREAEALQQEIQNLLDAQYGARDRALDQRVKEAQAAANWRNANAPYATTTDAVKEERELTEKKRTAYEYVKQQNELWQIARSVPGADQDWARWAKAQGVFDDIMKQMAFYNSNRKAGEPILEFQMPGGGKPQAPGPVGRPNPTTQNFEVGQVYKDAQGNKARYLGWEEIK